MGSDEVKIYDLVTKRFLAVFHPEAVFERTRVETTVRENVFRTSGRLLIEAGWRSVYGELSEQDRPDDDSGGDQLLPRLEQGEGVQTREVEFMRKETQPPRRFSDASLLGAMETAGKEIDDAELREAMKDSGIGTPATRASIIERLVDVGYIERDGRALVATEKGIQVIRLLGDHKLTSPELTGSWERRLRLIEAAEDTRPAFMEDIKKFTTETVQELDKLKGVQIERAKLGPCPICGREITENRKGYSCWSREDPGCGFVIWKKKAGKSLPVSVAKELIESLRVSRESGEDPGVGRTEKAVTGFRSRAGRTFRAKLRLEQTDEAKWRVEFDEEWAKEPPKGESEEERAEREAGGPRSRPRTPWRGAGRGREAAESETAAPAARRGLTAALRAPRSVPAWVWRFSFPSRNGNRHTPLTGWVTRGNLPSVSGGCPADRGVSARSCASARARTAARRARRAAVCGARVCEGVDGRAGSQGWRHEAGHL